MSDLKQTLTILEVASNHLGQVFLRKGDGATIYCRESIEGLLYCCSANKMQLESLSINEAAFFLMRNGENDEVSNN